MWNGIYWFEWFFILVVVPTLLSIVSFVLYYEFIVRRFHREYNHAYNILGTKTGRRIDRYDFYYSYTDCTSPLLFDYDKVHENISMKRKSKNVNLIIFCKNFHKEYKRIFSEYSLEEIKLVTKYTRN